MKQTTLRVYWADYLKIRKIFPVMRNESAASYFRRFALWLQAFKVFCPKENENELQNMRRDDIE